MLYALLYTGDDLQVEALLKASVSVLANWPQHTPKAPLTRRVAPPAHPFPPAIDSRRPSSAPYHVFMMLLKGLD